MSLPLSDMCRFCMAKDDEVVYIFCEDALTDIINGCLPIKINMNDDLPKTMCSQCYECIDNFSRFRNLVLESEAKYNAFLSKSRIKSEVLSNLNIIESNMKHIVAGSQQNNVELIIGSNQSNYDLRNTVSFNNDDDLTQDMDDKMGINPMELVESDASDSGTANNHNDNSQDIEFTPRGIETVYVTASQPGTSGMQPSEIVEGLNLTVSSHQRIISPMTTEMAVTYMQSASGIQYVKQYPYFNDSFIHNKELFTYKHYPRINNSSPDINGQSQVSIPQVAIPMLAPLMPIIDTSEVENNSTCNSSEIDIKPLMQPEVNTEVITTKTEKNIDKTYQEHNCELCDVSFTSFIKLSYHIKSTHEERKFACEVCSRKFITAHHLKMHSAMHMTVKPFACDECPSTFRYKKVLDQHKLTQHIVQSGDAEFPFACSMCEMKFSSRNTYNHHAKSHRGGKGPFPCDVCLKELATKESLSCHKLTHTGEKSLICEVCNKAFSHRKYYVVHKRIHTGERPYMCATCGKSFTQASTLTVHRRYHTGERPYVCSVCNKGFVTRTIMLTHMKKHKDEVVENGLQ